MSSTMANSRFSGASLIRSVPQAMGPPAIVGGLAWGLIRDHAAVANGYAWTGLVLASLGGILIIALHFLVQWNPLDRFVSEYARDQKWGLLMDWAFACLGLSSIALGMGVSAAFFDPPFKWDLIVSGVLILFLSIFVCDSHVSRRNATLTKEEVEQGPQGQTPEGGLHDLFVGSAFFAYIVGMIWFCLDSNIAMGLRGTAVQRLTGTTFEWLRVASFSLGNLALVCAIVFVLLIWKVPQKSPVGLAQRAVILCLFEWIGLMVAAVVCR